MLKKRHVKKTWASNPSTSFKSKSTKRTTVQRMLTLCARVCAALSSHGEHLYGPLSIGETDDNTFIWAPGNNFFFFHSQIIVSGPIIGRKRPQRFDEPNINEPDYVRRKHSGECYQCTYLEERPWDRSAVTHFVHERAGARVCFNT